MAKRVTDLTALTVTPAADDVLVRVDKNDTSSFPEYSSNTGSDLQPTTKNYYSGINMDTTIDDRNIKAILSAIGVKNVC